MLKTDNTNNNMASILDSHSRFNHFKVYTGLSTSESVNVVSSYILERAIIKTFKEAMSKEEKGMFLLGKRMMDKDECILFVVERVQKISRKDTLKSMFDYLTREGVVPFLKNITRLKKIKTGEL
jgi:hypothetical protein